MAMMIVTIAEIQKTSVPVPRISRFERMRGPETSADSFGVG